jgi:dTDP-4-dehydrorhamnose 3,5-epimerase
MKLKPKIIQSNKPIADLVVLELPTFQDYRGENFEGFSSDFYSSMFHSLSSNWEKEAPKFEVDSFSRSRYSVLRGYHGDTKAWKLIQVLQGSVWFSVLDTRKDSPSSGVRYDCLLSAENKRQVLVPRGCVNAHQCLTSECLFSYKLTGGYVNPEDQIHVSYTIGSWPIDSAILSERDKK